MIQPFSQTSEIVLSQLAFAEAQHAIKKCKTRRELFLEKLEILLQWKLIEAPIRKHYA